MMDAAIYAMVQHGVPRVSRTACAAALLLALTAAPGFAEHRARLSADLADHLAAGSQSIDVIVHGDQATVDALASRYNVVVKRRMKSGGVLRVNAGQLDALQRDPDVDHLSGDIPLRPSMAITNVAIGADQVWAGDGDIPSLTGKGVTVAVIDSGISDKHNALRRRVIATMDFTGGDGVDRYGHGTHVAAIIAGQAGRTVETRELQGVAPGAYLVNLRVLGDDGSGVISSVVEAIDWAIEHKQQYHIGVINLSLGAPVLQPYRDDPMCEAVERAVRAGIVVVAAAGNFGTNLNGQTVLGGITSPGNDPYVLTVGAIDTHGTPGAVRRHGGGVQLARADDVRPGDEAGRGGAGQPHRVGGGRRVGGGAGASRAARHRRPARTPTSSSPARAWRRGRERRRWRCCCRRTGSSGQPTSRPSSS